MKRNNTPAVRGKFRAAVFFTAVSLGILAIAGGFSACNGGAGDRDGAHAPAERLAVLRVEAGDGRLAGGEVFTIAEWRSGKRDGGGAFADFRGQDGGPTLDLAISGLEGIGSYACDGSGAASLRLGVDVNNIYLPAEGECRIVVDRVANGVAEGRYTAVLRHEGNPRDAMKVSGTFRATSAPAIAAASASKIAPKVVGLGK